MFGLSLSFLCIFAYAWSVGGAGRFLWALLFQIVGTALFGISESLPENRREAAGVLRLTALVVLMSMIVIMIVTPELFIN